MTYSKIFIIFFYNCISCQPTTFTYSLFATVNISEKSEHQFSVQMFYFCLYFQIMIQLSAASESLTSTVKLVEYLNEVNYKVMLINA